MPRKFRSIKILGFLLLSLALLHESARAQNYPRDTSYTIQSAYHKNLKKFPFVEIVESAITDSVKATRDITYKSVENHALKLDVFAPQSIQSSAPAVVLVHGGGWISGDKSMIEPLAIQLALNGYVAVCVEYRLSPEAAYPAAIYDIKDAIKWLKGESKKYAIDTNQVAILGTSAGGQIATLIGVTNGDSRFDNSENTSKHSSDVQAIINMDGVLAFHHPLSEEGHVAGLWLGGTYEKVPDTWADASPINHIDPNDPPILFVHSQYPRFHAGRAEVVAQLTTFGIYTEVHGFDDCPHNFWLFEPWFDPTVEYVLGFLNKVF